VTIHGDTNSGNISMHLQMANIAFDDSLGIFDYAMSVLGDASNYQFGPVIRRHIPKPESLRANGAKAFQAIKEFAVSADPTPRLDKINSTSKHGEDK
jgi:hypothetical protein